MRFPVHFFFAIIMAAVYLWKFDNVSACSTWTAAALVISCFRKDG